MIQTPRLQLLPCSLEYFELLLQGNDHLADLLGISIPEGWTEYPEMVLVAYDKLRNDPAMLGWFFYLVIHRADKRLIGAGGFKGKPNEDGLVEMGYEIAARLPGKRTGDRNGGRAYPFCIRTLIRSPGNCPHGRRV
ncbi:hypothetical protein [Chitinophaga sp. OAE865]|uniref:GNAT family N-acetyltransferase n=1 Tax=Chitinophaga sp. OAE865 TaxID=2817898 RepID=UPI003398423A